MALQQARGVQPLSLTNAQRSALTGDQRPVGLIIYNTDLNEAEMWTGVNWIVLGDQPGSMVYKGLIDATSACPEDGAENGWFYINTSDGTTGNCWTGGDGIEIVANDRLVFDGTNWAIYSVASPGSLQQVTDVGSTTTNTITAGGFTTAGTVAGEDATFGGTGTFADDVSIGAGPKTTLAKDGSASFDGTVTAPTFSGSLSGNASTATKADSADKLTTARSIGLSGDASGSANFDGSANITISTSVSNATNSTNATNATNTTNVNINTDNSSGNNRFVTFSNSQSGNQRISTDNTFYFSPGENRLYVPIIRATTRFDLESLNTLP